MNICEWDHRGRLAATEVVALEQQLAILTTWHVGLVCTVCVSASACKLVTTESGVDRLKQTRTLHMDLSIVSLRSIDCSLGVLSYAYIL